MEKPEISIIIPSIRKENLVRVYNSILTSTKRSFEVIFAGPNSLPSELEQYRNIKVVRDFGSPIRASQMAALLAEGKLITWSADDALFLHYALDKNIDLLYEQPFDQKNVVVAKYYEGKNGISKPLQPDIYFKINGSSWTQSQFISDDWYIFNVAIMYRSFFEELGGWSCDFDACPLSHTDLAIRSYHAGAKVVMSNFALLDCDHSQPDHQPIENAMVFKDAPLYNYRFKLHPFDKNAVKIDFNNWRNCPAIWKGRFE